nr:tumor necrosis factor receptor superfamily member 23-like isoform X2 [Cavia porcellus]
MYKQSLQYSGPESCNADEYIYAHRCCKMCPTGQYVEKLCMRPHTQGVCVKCELGTFTAYANGLESCLVCSTCRADQEVVRECSPTTDRKCKCKQGYFPEDAGFSEFCTPCDKDLPLVMAIYIPHTHCKSPPGSSIPGMCIPDMSHV